MSVAAGIRLAGGEDQAVTGIVAASGTGMGIDAADIERLNAASFGSFSRCHAAVER